MISLAEAGSDEPSQQLPQSVRNTSFLRSTKDYLFGIALLLVVVLLWTFSNFVTQGLFVNGYHKPFLVTYLNTSSFTLYLLPFLFRPWFGRRSETNNNTLEARGHYETLPTSEHGVVENPPLYSARMPYVPTDVHPTMGEVITDPTRLAPLTTKETAHLASVFCFFWFIANWSVNAALDYTSVASSTILSSTSGFFTLAIGRLFDVEFLTPIKIVAVVTSFIGVLLVSLSDTTSSKLNASAPVSTIPAMTMSRADVYANPLLGDVLAILGAVFYALYVILLKVRIHSESRIDMQLFFGFVGAFNVIALFPVGLILHFSGHEPFQLPSTGKEWGAILVNMFITLSSDYIYVLAMLKTTPLVVTIGLSLTIPLAILGDEILNKPMKAQAGLGALLVLGSFGLIGWESAETIAQKNNLAEDDRTRNPSRDSLDAGQSRREDIEVD